MIHYDSIDLIDDNVFIVYVDCPTCVGGEPTDDCTCVDGLEAEAADLTILMRNLAVAGALCEVQLPCSSAWYPGCGKPWSRAP